MKDDLAVKDTNEMAKRTYNIAVEYVYKGIKENDHPSEEYKKTRYEKCKSQIALAGYRLADWLKEVLTVGSDEAVYADV